MNTAEALFFAVRLWLSIGAFVAAVFLTVGIDRVDEDARGAYVFRPLLVPGILLIWPLVVWRWGVLEMGRDRWAARYAPPRATHLAAALLMAGAMVVAIWLGLSSRQDWPADIAPERLSAPEVSQ